MADKADKERISDEPVCYMSEDEIDKEIDRLESCMSMRYKPATRRIARLRNELVRRAVERERHGGGCEA